MLAHVLSDLRLYQRLVVLQLRTQAQYKLNVFVDIGASFAMTCLEFFGIWVYFGTFPSMLGWKVGEVALVYGLMSMSFGMAELFGAGIDMFPEMIRLGDFDRMLLRPAAPLMLVVGSDFRLRRLGRISQGIVTFCFALYLLPDLHWTWLKLIVLPIGIASGALIFISILLLGATLCFWTVETTELTGILVPSSGEIRVAELNPLRQRREMAGCIGVVFGQRSQLWWDLPLIDSLRLLRHLYRIPEARYTANLAQMRSMLALDEFIDTPVRQLSLGQRMRGDLAAALLHDPELLYLDEPTIGLDVVAKARIREFLLAINRERGVTVLLTTHDMDDVEALCPRMLIIDHGRKLYDGAVADIRERFGGTRTLIAVLDAAELATLPHDGAGQLLLEQLPAGVHLVRAEAPRLWLGFSREGIPAHELVAWLGTRYKLRDVTFQEPEIEDVIRRIYEEGLLLKDTLQSS